MANTKRDQKEISVKEAAEVFNVAAIGGDTKGITFQDAWEVLEKLDENQFQEIATEEVYDLGAEGSVHNLIFEGMTTIEIKGQKKEVARIRDKEGKTYINWDAVLVKACQGLQLIPCFIKVTNLGTVPGVKGEYKKLSVKALGYNR